MSDRTDLTWALFTKPWRNLSVGDLADLVARLGFDAVEFPLRPGYQVDLDNLPASLSELSKALADHDLTIASVASNTTPAVFEACAEAGVPLIRIMVPVDPAGYTATADAIHHRLDEIVPLSQRYGVKVGVQPHYDDYIADSSELAVLLRDYDPATVVAIWDAAHDGLARKHPAHSLELLWDHLAMVNFKNACYQPTSPPQDDGPPWKVSFVPARHGLSSWPDAARYLTQRGYSGPICLPAEYTDESDLERKVADDLRFLRTLIEGEADQ